MDYLASQEAFAAADASGKFKAWTDQQLDGLELWDRLSEQRLLLYYPTGKGKTKMSLAMLRNNGFLRAIVIAPPKTGDKWQEDARTLGMTLVFMSHEKFRMKNTTLPRGVPIIVDEFHKLGKHNGVGFKKLDRMAARFPGIILCSATPNYNDADRCYNVCHVLDTINNMGGYPQWVATHCQTVPNPFSKGVDVVGFLQYDGAPDFLASLPYCAYVEDEAEWEPDVLPINIPITLDAFEEYGYSGRKHRIMASQMEGNWHRERLILLREDQAMVRLEVFVALKNYMVSHESEKFLLYSRDKDVAKALWTTFLIAGGYKVFLVTGDTKDTDVPLMTAQFVTTKGPAVFIGTDALVTGVDGLDTVCDHLIIVNDTNDDSLRRQLYGRVLPRGDYNRKTYVTTVVTSLQP